MTAQKFATPVTAGNYMSTCSDCQRAMQFADKRCITCTDCAKPQEAVTSKPRVYTGWLTVNNGVQILGNWVDENDYERLQRDLDNTKAELTIVECERKSAQDRAMRAVHAQRPAAETNASQPLDPRMVKACNALREILAYEGHYATDRNPTIRAIKRIAEDGLVGSPEKSL